jgi:fumarate reductase subunit C
MSEPAGYTAYHPRWRRARMSTWWWLTRGSYLAFILRELSSLFVAWSVVFFLLLIREVSAGPSAYARFLAWSGHPLVLLLNGIGLAFIVFHAITWFNLAPQAMVVRVRGARVPGLWIALANYGVWALVSAALAWFLLRG